jgi:GNAT superfamily N-acetyltransferase
VSSAPPDLVLREARVEDAEGFVRAYEVAWDATLAEIAGARLDTFMSFDARVESFRAGLARQAPDSRVWVAEMGGEIVGTAVCRREGETSAELSALYVVPASWGTGVARALMDAALASMQELGARDAVLWVGEANGRARRFYEREGWVDDGTSRASEIGPPEVRYRLELAGG